MNAHEKVLTKDQIRRINAALAGTRGISAESITEDIEKLPKHYECKPWKINNPLTKIVGVSEGLGWMDHCRIEWHGGRKVYVANPYVLGLDDFEDFKKLEAHGYSVKVLGRSNYSPGAIRVEVWLSRK